MAEITPQTNIDLPSNPANEIGQTGTYFFKGYITNEEYSIDLQGKYGLQVYDVMRKSDATVHAALNICKHPIQGADWDFDPASPDPADLKIAEQARFEFFKRRSEFTFHETMREGLTFLDMGFYTGEIVWDPDAVYEGRGYWGIKKIGFRKQRSILKWEMDDGNPGITQILPNGGSANIPRSKLLVCVNDKEGDNFYGVSLLRYAYKPWKIKDGLEIMNAIALEKLAMGIPYIKKGIDGKTVDEGELDKARKMLRQQRLNEEAMWEYPDGVEMGFTDMKAHSTKDVMPTIEYQDKQILLSVLGQFLLLGSSGSAGSRAVSADHSRMFVKALEAVANQWRDAFQRDVVDRWAAMNFSSLPNGAPRLVYSTISDEDMGEMATAVSNLMNAGALTADKDVENRIRKTLNLPALSSDAYENYDENKAAEQAAAAAAKTKGIQPDLADEKKPKDQLIAEGRLLQRRLLQAIIDEE